jgi:hypothetical protein
MVSKDGDDDAESQAPPQMIEQPPDIREEIIRFFGKIGHRIVNGGVEEQIDVSQHHQVAQSSGWSQKMEKMMGDLEHVLKSSNGLEMSETRSSDFSKKSHPAMSVVVLKNKSMFLSTTRSHNHRVGLNRWRR